MGIITHLIDWFIAPIIVVVLIGAYKQGNTHVKEKYNCKSLWDYLRLKIKCFNCRFFYEEDIIKRIIAGGSVLEVKNKYIDYYNKDEKIVEIRINGISLTKRLQYSELIDYVTDINRKVLVLSENIEEYKLSDDLVELTKNTLNDFYNKKPNTYNEKTLRISSLKEEKGNLVCKLQRSDYNTQIRTNISVDVRYQHKDRDFEYSLRDKEIKMSGEGKLIEFEKSSLANSIGVSAVWHFIDPNTGKQKFFLKPRTKGVGVFSNMLGTVSGVVKCPEDLVINNLEEYLKKEIKREFFEETGFGNYIQWNNEQVKKGENIIKINEDDVKITSLAFMREFARGGKPQFFYMISTPYISDFNMARFYKKSQDGLKEFDDGIFRNKLQMLHLSQETWVNFIYAFKLRQGNPRIINLDPLQNYVG